MVDIITNTFFKRDLVNLKDFDVIWAVNSVFLTTTFSRVDDIYEPGDSCKALSEIILVLNYKQNAVTTATFVVNPIIEIALSALVGLLSLNLMIVDGLV